MTHPQEAPATASELWSSVEQVPYSTAGYGGGTMLRDQSGACIGYVITLNKSEHHDPKALDTAVFSRLAASASEFLAASEAWRSPDTVPKYGSILELVVDYTEGHSPLEDGLIGCTIGWNSLSETGEDEWQIVGWDWCQDHIRNGAGEILAWRPSRLAAQDIGTWPRALPHVVAAPSATSEDGACEDVKARARVMLAAEYQADGARGPANDIVNGNTSPDNDRALRAIAKALASRGEG